MRYSQYQPALAFGTVHQPPRLSSTTWYRSLPNGVGRWFGRGGVERIKKGTAQGRAEETFACPSCVSPNGLRRTLSSSARSYMLTVHGANAHRGCEAKRHAIISVNRGNLLSFAPCCVAANPLSASLWHSSLCSASDSLPQSHCRPADQACQCTVSCSHLAPSLLLLSHDSCVLSNGSSLPKGSLTISAITFHAPCLPN